jgi:hypothetical protein
MPGYKFLLFPYLPIDLVRDTRALINNSQTVTFFATARREDPFDERNGLWTWTYSPSIIPPGGFIQNVALVGTFMPSPPGLPAQQLLDIGMFDCDGSNRVAFRGFCDSFEAVWLAFGTTITLADHGYFSGENGARYYGGPFLNSANRAFVHRGDRSSTCFRFIQRITSGASVIVGGAPAPGTNNLEWTQESCAMLSPPLIPEVAPFCGVMNDTGRAITRHGLYDKEDPFPNPERPADGIWYWNGTSATRVVIDEDDVSAWTGFDGDTVSTCVTSHSELAINATDQAVFGFLVRRPTGLEWPTHIEREILMARRTPTAVVPRIIVSEGEILSLPNHPQPYRVTRIFFGSGAKGRTDNPRSGHGLLNNAGYTAYKVNLVSDGTGGERQVIFRTRL